MNDKNMEKVFKMSFASVYPHYVTKIEKKGRDVKELYEVIYWLTGYTETDLQKIIDEKINFKDFFENAPKFNENANKSFHGYDVEFSLDVSLEYNNIITCNIYLTTKVRWLSFLSCRKS